MVRARARNARRNRRAKLHAGHGSDGVSVLGQRKVMFGLDLLGLAAFPSAMARAFPRGFACGVFHDTFGNPYRHLERILLTGKCPLVRVHAIWEDDHQYIPFRDDSRITAAHRKLVKFAAKFPNVAFQFSPFCEAKGDLGPILTKLKADTPFQLVNSVWQGPAQKPGVAINEYHGKEAGRQRGLYNFSWDGDSTVDGDVTALKKRHKGAQVHFFWHPSFNGKRNVKDTTPRPERKFWPVPELIQSVAYLANQKGRPNFPTNWLWKSHSDVHKVPPEPRAYKPVLIADIKVDSIPVRSMKGKLLTELKYFDRFDGGGYRYYLDMYGYELAEAARAHAESPLVRLGEYGTVNPAFREGNYR